MKLFKKIFILTGILLSTCIVSVSVSAQENANVLVNEPSINDDFSNSEILVMLDEEASRSCKQYNEKDFMDIGCIAVEDLTSTATKTVLNNLDNDLVNYEQYNRILCLYLDEKSKDNVLEGIHKLSAREDVLSAIPNYNVTTYSTSSNDEYITDQWGLNNINLPQAWDYSTGSSSVYVGIIDSGIDGSHPDLGNQLVRNLCRDFSSGQEVTETSPYDVLGHGTHVAGIIGAIGNNNQGVCGVNFNVGLVSLRVFDDEGDSNFSGILQAIDYAQRVNIPILNMSLGITDAFVNSYLSSYITSYNGVVVCAAGNEGYNIDNTPIYPASCTASNIITVGAIDSNNARSIWRSGSSNFGSNSVDIYAPGTNILSTYPTHLCDEFDYVFSDGTRLCEISLSKIQEFIQIIEINSMSWENFDENFSDIIEFYYSQSLNPSDFASSEHKANGYHFMNGTSMAAPFVAGVAALLLSENQNLSASQIKSAILSGANNISITIPGSTKTVKKLNSKNSISSVHIVHSYKHWEYKDRISHIEKCVCGVLGSKTAAHMIKSSDLLKPTAVCVDCYAVLNMKGDGDIGMVPGVYSLRKNYITDNGSYILPNGIIVLVDEDYLLYLNGELHLNF